MRSCPRMHQLKGEQTLNGGHLDILARIHLTASSNAWNRPYHKNDNRLVEQKNYTLVRQYVGYGRLYPSLQE